MKNWQRLNINIKMSTYLRAKQSGDNLSRLIDTLLQGYYKVEDFVDQEEHELVSEINREHANIEAKQKELAELQAKLLRKRNQIADQKKEFLDKQLAIVDSIRNSGWMGDM
jgi:GTP cyclohydrolase FolE2